MKLTIKTCYSRVLWVMFAGEAYSQAVSQMSITSGPHFEHEGVAGYIETEVVFEIKDLKKFTDIWESWYLLSDTRKLDLYSLAKGYGGYK